jgi:hypothetical protein
LIAIMTIWLWTPVWIAVTVSKRRKPRWGYCRLFVDHLGHVSREKIPAPAGSAEAVGDRAPALQRQLA